MSRKKRPLEKASGGALVGDPEQRGIPYTVAVERGICGAQRKNESAPCENPRDWANACKRHCSHKLRMKDRVCADRPMSNGSCRRHGGKSRQGVAHPNFVHGRYAHAGMPTKLLQSYQRRYEDSNYLVMRDEIAVVDALVEEALSRVDLDDPEARDRAIKDALGAIEQGRKIRDSERKRLTDAQQAMTADRAMTLAAALLDAVRAVEDDPKKLNEITRRFNEATSSIY